MSDPGHQNSRLVAALKALLGAVPPRLHAAIVNVDDNPARLRLLFLNGLSEADIQVASEIDTNFQASFHADDHVVTSVEIVESDGVPPINSSEEFVFLRISEDELISSGSTQIDPSLSQGVFTI